MRTYIKPGHSLRITPWVGIVAIVFAVAGCSSSPAISKTDEAQMRAEMTKKGPVNMKDLPADQQAKIQAFFQKGGGAPSAQGQSSGSSQ